MVSPASRTMVFESSMGCQMDLDVQEIYVSQWFNHHRLEDVGPSPWTLWRDFLWLCHQSLPVGIMLRAVDGWAPKKRSPFARQTVLTVQLLQNYSFVWFGTDAGNLQDNTCTCLSAWTLQINPGLGSEIVCNLNLKQTYIYLLANTAV